MSADTERSKLAKTDTDTDISAKMSAETDNFLSLIQTKKTNCSIISNDFVSYFKRNSPKNEFVAPPVVP